MSNTARRPEFHGVILQENRVVGGIELPRSFEQFIEQFNREYRPLGLVVRPVPRSPTQAWSVVSETTS